MNMHAIRSTRGRGLSLIELLVAVAIGGILMGGAISLFVNNRATYEITNDMARLQENARFALQVLTEDIRMAGYVGCVNDFTKVQSDTTGIVEGDLASFAHAIEAYESGDTTWTPSGHAGSYLADSDGITVRYFQGDRSKNGTTVNYEVINESPKDASTSNPVLLVRNLSQKPGPGDLYSVSDCGGADVFTVNGNPGTDATTGADTITASGLSRSYEALNRALVAPAVGVRYFVQNNSAGIPALYRTTLTPGAPATETAPEELVDGVQSLQLLYGVDSDQDGIPNAFLSAGDSIADPADNTKTVTLQSRNDFLSVVAVKIALLMETVDAFGDVPQDEVYDVGAERFCRTGLVAVPACTRFFTQDRRRRRVFQTTVGVRNFQ